MNLLCFEDSIMKLSLYLFSLYLCLLFYQLKNVSANLQTYEGRLRETEEEHSTDLENTLIRLEEEQQRFFELFKLFLADNLTIFCLKSLINFQGCIILYRKDIPMKLLYQRPPPPTYLNYLNYLKLD